MIAILLILVLVDASTLIIWYLLSLYITFGNHLHDKMQNMPQNHVDGLPLPLYYPDLAPSD